MATPCLSMDTVPHSTLHTCTHSHSQHNRPHSHTVPSPLTSHTAPGLHECMHAHTCPHLEVGVAGRGSGWRREEEGSCPYLDLHLDLQVGPVDGEQRAVRAGGAQLPGTVGHVPVAVSQEDQRGEGDLAGEGALVCRGRHGGLHFRGRPHMVDLSPHQRGRGTGRGRGSPATFPLPSPSLHPTTTYTYLLHLPTPTQESAVGINAQTHCSCLHHSSPTLHKQVGQVITLHKPQVDAIQTVGRPDRM